MTDDITLKVKEAHHQDAGRSIARIDTDAARQLELSTGDVVFIEGDERTVASVYPGYPGDVGQGVVRIDGATRRNAGVGIDDRVTIRRAEAERAAQLELKPVEDVDATSLRDYVRKRLEGRPVTEGDQIQIDVMGHRIAFRVAGYKPKGDSVIVGPRTQVEIGKKPSGDAVVESTPRVSYEDIGGLEPQIRRVREMIELPMRHPEVFERIGVEPPKGLLLHGPPGTGKTLLAKAVANETQASFFHIGGPEVMSKFYGESEERLRETFEEAQDEAPSIIFIDELDSIAPNRDEVTGEVERRVVAQLLSLMDGLEERGQVVVIGATNRVDAVDPALRRPGRFDREIEIGVPDSDERLEILQVHTRGVPLAEEIDLESYADRMHGYVGADIAALCREAAMEAVRDIIPEIDLEAEEVPPEVLEDLVVDDDHLETAFTQLSPSAMRELLVETPDVTWDDVGGLDDAKQELIEAVQWPLDYGDLYEHMGSQIPKGVLLHGPPGTGKTLLAKALAAEAGVNFISVKGPELLSKWVGESEKGVREVFEKARQNAPCVVFFDELDALASERGAAAGDSRVGERVVSQFLTELDGLETLKDVVVVGSTNRLDLIDDALLRPGRFDRLVEVPKPDAEARREILAIHSADLPLAEDVDVDGLVDATEDFNGAELAAICREASLLAVRDFVGAGGDPDDEDAVVASKVTQDHLEHALQKIRSRRERKADSSRGDEIAPVEHTA